MWKERQTNKQTNRDRNRGRQLDSETARGAGLFESEATCTFISISALRLANTENLSEVVKQLKCAKNTVRGHVEKA